MERLDPRIERLLRDAQVRAVEQLEREHRGGAVLPTEENLAKLALYIREGVLLQVRNRRWVHLGVTAVADMEKMRVSAWKGDPEKKEPPIAVGYAFDGTALDKSQRFSHDIAIAPAEAHHTTRQQRRRAARIAGKRGLR